MRRTLSDGRKSEIIKSSGARKTSKTGCAHPLGHHPSAAVGEVGRVLKGSGCPVGSWAMELSQPTSGSNNASVADEPTLFMLELSPPEPILGLPGSADDPLMNGMAALARELEIELNRIDGLRFEMDRKPFDPTTETTYLPKWPEAEHFPGHTRYLPGAYEWMLGMSTLSVALQARPDGSGVAT